MLKVADDEDLVAEHLEEALQFHRSVSGQAAAHLGLLADNTFRAPWLAAKLLPKDKNFARDAARAFAETPGKYKGGTTGLHSKRTCSTQKTCSGAWRILQTQSLQFCCGMGMEGMRLCLNFSHHVSCSSLTMSWI